MRLQRFGVALLHRERGGVLRMRCSRDLFDEIYARGQPIDSGSGHSPRASPKRRRSELLTTPLVARGTLTVDASDEGAC